MRQTTAYCITGLVLIGVLLSSCSTQKNTWATRSYHQMKTKYNIYFNGYTAFQEGEKSIREASKDDYSALLNLYPISDHEAAAAATSSMDKTIEKCRKCIKLHSIKSRPKVNPRKRKDPRYQLWLQQEEFNDQMSNAWLLLAKAEFHKGDFLGSISTFNYIARHYASDLDMVAQCQLWTARAYGELGWLYEAEDVLRKVQIDNLSRKHAALYSAVSADILLKTGQHKEAIPFIKTALADEDRKGNRPRFWFVLGQLYQEQGNARAARNAYGEVLKLQPTNEMDFQARLRQAQMEDNPATARKTLLKMAGQDKNKDKLDCLYGAVGDVYLAHHDTANALKYYELAIASSTENGQDKAAVLVEAGNIYYNQRNYIPAGECYREATTILSTESEAYRRIQRRSEALGELAVAYNMVQLQDSLQHLATLPPAAQRAVVDTLIARLIRAEQEEAERAEQAAREAANDTGGRSVNTANMLGGGNANASWYFYNPQLMRSGKQQFRSRWGNRALEDDWRRLSKSVTASSLDYAVADEDEDAQPADSLSADSTGTATPSVVLDSHSPEFYLQQIPRTETDLQRSDSLIADALYSMIYIYRDKVGDEALSEETFAQFCHRFPSDKRLAGLYYMQYLTALKEQRTADAEVCRQRILTQYPSSHEATLVAQPDYFERLRHTIRLQDSLYEATYNAYTQGDYAAVKGDKQYAEEHYPLSPLLPRFLFLNAVATAKTDGQEAFVEQLRDMIQRYPDSELSTMAKDMLAMMGQGFESQQGGTMASLQTRRAAEQPVAEEQDSTIGFSAEQAVASYVVLITPAEESVLNRTLYEVALFNFSQFMIKDFDLKIVPVFSATQGALLVSGFETLSEAEWYRGLLQSDTALAAFCADNSVQTLCITAANYALLNTRFSVEDYRAWQSSQP